MSDQGKQYVYNGVLLRCDKGVVPTPFTVLPRPSRIRGQFQAHELDKVPLVNIKPFGVCAITHAPCMPAPVMWTGVHQGALRLGPMHAHPLLESSTCQCGVGGKISIIMLPAVGASGAAPPAPTAAERGDATAHEIADHAKLAALGFAVLGVGLAIAGCFFPPLELAAAASFETAMAASASAAFVAADVSMAIGVGIDVGVAVAHPTPANRAVVVGDALGLALGYGIGKALGAAVSKFGPTVAEMFAQRAAQKAAAESEAGLAIGARKAATETVLPEGIEANPQGVHGYMPKAGSRYADADFTNPKIVAENRAIRLKYLDESHQIDKAVAEMRTGGKSSEDIARHVVEMRNQQKIVARGAMNPEAVAKLEAGNMKKYGHPVGPTADKLFKDNGSWEAVIEKATQKDEAINMLLGIKH